MILAAGRGVRMRPLTDQMPKPLQRVRGKPLIEWQIEALVRSGLRHLVINASWLQQQLQDQVGDGARWGAQVHWSCEEQPLGTAGGIATALPWLTDPAFVVVSGDIFTHFDYATLLQGWEQCSQPAGPQSPLCGPAEGAGAQVPQVPQAHLVLVQDARYPCDFTLQAGRIGLPQAGLPAGTYGNIGVYRRAFFEALPRHRALDLGPMLRQAASAGCLSGQWCQALWENVGTVEDLARLNAC